MRLSRVSALRRYRRRFQRRELAGVGVERVRAAEGDGLVAAGVAEGCPEHHRDTELAQSLRHDFFPALRIFARRREIAHHERLRSVEGAAEGELREQPIEAVRRLAPGFPQPDAGPKIRLA